MSEYPSGSVEDRKMLKSLTTDELLDVLFLHVRNLWRVDGLYFLGIEKKFGTEAAAQIDAEAWATMAAIEARSLQKMFKIGDNPDVPAIVNLMRKTSWALDQPFKTLEVSPKRAVLRIDKCRTQETRLGKGLEEFPCKGVRFGYLRNFAKTLNSKIDVNCIVCPPDKHPEDSWCRWEFKLP